MVSRDADVRTRGIDNRRKSRGVLVLSPRIKTENALPGRRRQYGSCRVLFQQVALAIKEKKEKRLILDDRPGKAAAELVAIVIVALDIVQIIEEIIRIEFGIAIRPEQRSTVLIRSRTRKQLNLS